MEILTDLDLKGNKILNNAPIDISGGGTGASTASQARVNLGVRSGNTSPTSLTGTDGDIYFQYGDENNKYQTLVQAIPLPSNCDLNTITTPNEYYCPSGIEAKKYTNCPYTDYGFRLLVRGEYGGTTWISQEIKSAYDGQTFFRRKSDTGTWQDWFYQPCVRQSYSDRMDDYIVEQGTKDFWTWRKWKSGVMEMWGTWKGSLTPYSSTVIPTHLPYGYTKSFTLPVSFANSDYAKTFTANVGSGYGIPASGGMGDTVNSLQVHFISNVGGTNTRCQVNLQLKGRWG